MTAEKKKKWHSLTYHKNDGSWVLCENREDKYRGKQLKKYYTKDFKYPKQAASEVISRVRELLGTDLVRLQIYVAGSYKTIKTINFSGAANESTL